MRPLIEAFPKGLINLPSTDARPVTSPNIPGAPAGRAIRSHPSVSTPSLSTKASFWASKTAGLFQMFPQLLTEVNWLSLGHFMLPCISGTTNSSRRTADNQNPALPPHPLLAGTPVTKGVFSLQMSTQPSPHDGESPLTGPFLPLLRWWSPAQSFPPSQQVCGCWPRDEIAPGVLH